MPTQKYDALLTLLEKILLFLMESSPFFESVAQLTTAELSMLLDDRLTVAMQDFSRQFRRLDLDDQPQFMSEVNKRVSDLKKFKNDYVVIEKAVVESLLALCSDSSISEEMRNSINDRISKIDQAITFITATGHDVDVDRRGIYYNGRPAAEFAALTALINTGSSSFDEKTFQIIQARLAEIAPRQSELLPAMSKSASLNPGSSAASEVAEPVLLDALTAQGSDVSLGSAAEEEKLSRALLQSSPTSVSGPVPPIPAVPQVKLADEQRKFFERAEKLVKELERAALAPFKIEQFLEKQANLLEMLNLFLEKIASTHSELPEPITCKKNEIFDAIKTASFLLVNTGLKRAKQILVSVLAGDLLQDQDFTRAHALLKRITSQFSHVIDSLKVTNPVDLNVLTQYDMLQTLDKGYKSLLAKYRQIDVCSPEEWIIYSERKTDQINCSADGTESQKVREMIAKDADFAQLVAALALNFQDEEDLCDISRLESALLKISADQLQQAINPFLVQRYIKMIARFLSPCFDDETKTRSLREKLRKAVRVSIQNISEKLYGQIKKFRSDLCEVADSKEPVSEKIYDQYLAYKRWFEKHRLLLTQLGLKNVQQQPIVSDIEKELAGFALLPGLFDLELNAHVVAEPPPVLVRQRSKKMARKPADVKWTKDGLPKENVDQVAAMSDTSESDFFASNSGAQDSFAVTVEPSIAPLLATPSSYQATVQSDDTDTKIALPVDFGKGFHEMSTRGLFFFYDHDSLMICLSLRVENSWQKLCEDEAKLSHLSKEIFSFQPCRDSLEWKISEFQRTVSSWILLYEKCSAAEKLKIFTKPPHKVVISQKLERYKILKQISLRDMLSLSEEEKKLFSDVEDTVENSGKMIATNMFHGVDIAAFSVVAKNFNDGKASAEKALADAAEKYEVFVSTHSDFAGSRLQKVTAIIRDRLAQFVAQEMLGGHVQKIAQDFSQKPFSQLMELLGTLIETSRDFCSAHPNYMFMYQLQSVCVAYALPRLNEQLNLNQTVLTSLGPEPEAQSITDICQRALELDKHVKQIVAWGNISYMSDVPLESSMDELRIPEALSEELQRYFRRVLDIMHQWIQQTEQELQREYGNNDALEMDGLHVLYEKYCLDIKAYNSLSSKFFSNVPVLMDEQKKHYDEAIVSRQAWQLSFQEWLTKCATDDKKVDHVTDYEETVQQIERFALDLLENEDAREKELIALAKCADSSLARQLEDVQIMIERSLGKKLNEILEENIDFSTVKGAITLCLGPEKKINAYKEKWSVGRRETLYKLILKKIDYFLENILERQTAELRRILSKQATVYVDELPFTEEEKDIYVQAIGVQLIKLDSSIKRGARETLDAFEERQRDALLLQRMKAEKLDEASWTVVQQEKMQELCSTASTVSLENLTGSKRKAYDQWVAEQTLLREQRKASILQDISVVQRRPIDLLAQHRVKVITERLNQKKIEWGQALGVSASSEGLFVEHWLNCVAITLNPFYKKLLQLIVNKYLALQKKQICTLKEFLLSVDKRVETPTILSLEEERKFFSLIQEYRNQAQSIQFQVDEVVNLLQENFSEIASDLRRNISACQAPLLEEVLPLVERVSVRIQYSQEIRGQCELRQTAFTEKLDTVHRQFLSIIGQLEEFPTSVLDVHYAEKMTAAWALIVDLTNMAEDVEFGPTVIQSKEQCLATLKECTAQMLEKIPKFFDQLLKNFQLQCSSHVKQEPVQVAMNDMMAQVRACDALVKALKSVSSETMQYIEDKKQSFLQSVTAIEADAVRVAKAEIVRIADQLVTRFFAAAVAAVPAEVKAASVAAAAAEAARAAAEAEAEAEAARVAAAAAAEAEAARVAAEAEAEAEAEAARVAAAAEAEAARVAADVAAAEGARVAAAEAALVFAPVVPVIPGSLQNALGLVVSDNLPSVSPVPSTPFSSGAPSCATSVTLDDSPNRLLQQRSGAPATGESAPSKAQMVRVRTSTFSVSQPSVRELSAFPQLSEEHEELPNVKKESSVKHFPFTRRFLSALLDVTINQKSFLSGILMIPPVFIAAVVIVVVVGALVDAGAAITSLFSHKGYNPGLFGGTGNESDVQKKETTFITPPRVGGPWG